MSLTILLQTVLIPLHVRTVWCRKLGRACGHPILMLQAMMVHLSTMECGRKVMVFMITAAVETNCLLCHECSFLGGVCR